MSPGALGTQRKLKYVSTINDETLGEDTDADFEIQYVDISNVDSSGNIREIVSYRFEDAPSRARRRVRDGDVIISTVRTYLQAIAPIKRPPENMIASTGFAVVRPGPTLDANYGKYALREQGFLTEVEKRSVGVSYPAINPADLGGIPVQVHPLAHQRTIADTLDRETARIDALVAEKERLLDLVAEKRRALITRAVIRGLNSNVSLRDSGISWLGEIPAHWKVIRLKFVCTEPLTYGANEAGLEDDQEFPRFIRITDINAKGNLIDETYRSLEPRIAEPYMLNEGDILLARSGATVGKAFLYKASWGPSCFAGYLIRLRCDKQLARPEFILAYTQSDPYWSQLREGTTQATIQNFSAEKYGHLFLTLPPLWEQSEIMDQLSTSLSDLDTLRSSTENTISLLRERRSALISAAITGQLEVT